MIRFLTTRRNRDPIRAYLAAEGKPLARAIVPMTYDGLFAARELPEGAYCFADLELLSDGDRTRAAEIWHRLEDRGCRLYNHPTRSLLRHDLLRMLCREGTNRFDVCRAGEAPRRFPVFLRGIRDHAGSRSPLLRSQAELDAAVALRDPGDTLVVEFCDTADTSGIYRKYGAFVVGGRVLARHLFFSREWVVKDWDLLDEEKLAEELRYVRENPHAERLSGIFRAAGIEYGRMDYSLLGDQIQVWEINTNPVILGIGPSVSRMPEGSLRGLRRLAGPLLARFPALAPLRVALARRLRKSTPRPRAAVHAAFAKAMEEALGAAAAPGAPPLHRG